MRRLNGHCDGRGERVRRRRKLRRTASALLAGACFAGIGSLAAAQNAPRAVARGDELQRLDRIQELQQLELDTRYRANEAVPPGQRMLIDYGGYVSFNYLSLDDPESKNHGLRETQGVGYVRMNYDGVHEVFIRGIWGWRDFNAGDSFDGRGDEPIDGDLDRAYYKFDLSRSRTAYGKTAPPVNFTFQGGRDFVYWANGLVLAEVLDGVILDFGTDNFTVQAVAGITPVRTVDIDSSRPNFDHNTRRGFYGVMATANTGAHRPFAYVLSQQDYNADDFRTVGFIDTKYEYNSTYLGLGSIGQFGDHFRYGVEFAYEFGNTYSNSFELQGFGISPVHQTNDAIDALALDARLDYFVNDPKQTRFGAELILATGDSNRGHTSNTFNGNRPHTEDHAFNAFGLVNTGLAFAPDVSNVLILRTGGSYFPLPDSNAFRRLQLGVDLFLYSKLQRNAPIDETTGEDRFLGFEPDIYLNWQVTSDVTLALRYGVFFPNEDNFPNDDARQFFYGSVTFAF